jgi:excinuclease ABC subunit A
LKDAKTARKNLKPRLGRSSDEGFVSSAPDDSIIVKKARVHNLKDVSVQLPRDKFVVITGPSGSGKSSLAFDTIYAEGQRRYVESLSAFARQFLEQMGKPDVESIEGLSPTISIEQRTTSYNPRSTVGTVTELYDYLRLLFARIGKPFCYECGAPIQAQNQQQIIDQILTLPENTKIALLAPVVRERKGEYQKELLQLRQKGFVRVRVDGEILDLAEPINLDKNKKHNIDVYIDRIILKGDRQVLSARVAESVELALKLGEGVLVLEVFSESGKPREQLISEKHACTKCNISYSALEPRSFSFNSPMGACSTCDGLGVDPSAETAQPDSESSAEVPVFFREVSPDTHPCKACNGSRLRRESLFVKIHDKNIADLSLLSISDIKTFFDTLVLSPREEAISGRVIKEIRQRLNFLLEVGVDYLSLSRPAQTLSGGEAQRIRLATQIGSSLVGVIYVLDEPSIGLHQRDNSKLLQSLISLKDLGNTVLVVEHDRETIERADYIVDLGPGAGARGGQVVGAGSLAEIIASKDSLTGKYLRNELEISVPKTRRPWTQGRVISVKGARGHNLKDISVDFPLGVFTCVTGVSGSGKSTLVLDTLYRGLLQHLYRVEVGPLAVQGIGGLDLIDKVIDIDQSPIGKTPRSNPATYTGLFTFIRDLFASLPESKIRGFHPGRYSFNVKGGRCEKCEGDGLTRIEMHFLPDVFVECETCRGKRYNRDTLEIRYKGKNIADVLDMPAEEALEFFDSIPSLKAKLKVLNDVGLGYVRLGQSATTLSGGEAQRIKLAKELSRRGTGRTIYILDEPSTGLHFDDIRKLVSILQSLVDQGNTVIVIEHNLDIIKVADHIIDIGPEGGKAGGEVVVTGTPEEVARVSRSHTGRYLKPYLFQ